MKTPEFSKEFEKTIKQIQFEISTNKRLYLQNCKQNYSQYINASLKMFSPVYEKMNKIDSQGDPWTKYNSISDQLKKDGDIDGEIDLLNEAVSNEVYTPSTYERLSKLYEEKKDFLNAYNICKKWFELDYWKLPNTSTGSLRILDRMEKLEKKI